MLHSAGIGALTVAVTGTGMLSYRAYDNRVLGADGGAAFDAWRHWRDDAGPRGVLAAAVLAASPHNTQPWLFHLSGDDRIELHADLSRRIGSVDPYACETHVGLGCALENLALAAHARGLEPRITLRPEPGRPSLVAPADLTKATQQHSPLYDAIGYRHTNRGPYRDRPIDTAVLTDLAALADDPRASVIWVTTRAGRDDLGDLMIRAARAVTEDEQQSRENFAWFRGSADAIEKHKDGLTLDGQGLSAVVTSAAKLMPATSRTSGDAFWVKQTRTVHTATATVYGLVLVPDRYDPLHQLTGGRLLERIHLAVTARGLALQHMNQITERIDRDRSQGRDPVFGPPLAALADRAGGDGRQVLAAFRLGHPVRPGRRSPRRPATQVLR
ncbi:hypothetical protein SVIO_008380 [Streptomyces violaceusniger]|uniref:Nitroreductase domain-containing protein n=1 Tax=Streptomyces violaceusniger TaxID=68280 RepID=A0A4D4KMT1_STRVO|nr:hypothetical protein SVIO_008380 [Streptomyces violaceusniger]